MGIFDKIKGMVTDNDSDYNEYDGDLFGDDAPGESAAYNPPQGASAQDGSQYDPQPAADPQPQQTRSSGQGRYEPKAAPAPSSSSSSPFEMKVVKPERFDEATLIADHLQNHSSVVLNLESANKETARRMIDFLSGVAYAIHGQLRRVANNTFVITPDNVEVSNDPLRREEPKPNQTFDGYYSDQAGN